MGECEKGTSCLQPLRFGVFLFQKLAHVLGVSGPEVMTEAAVSRSWSQRAQLGESAQLISPGDRAALGSQCADLRGVHEPSPGVVCRRSATCVC